MNKIVEPENKEIKQKKKSNNFFFKYVRPILDGSILSRERTEKNFLFIFYII